MTAGNQRRGNRSTARVVLLDRSFEQMPVFRLSDSSDEASIDFEPTTGGRWRVMPAPGERLPGTFDQDVYVEIFRRYHDLGQPPEGSLAFTLHAFLRSMGRRVDGRTYAQLRSALTRLHRTRLESDHAYHVAGKPFNGTFSVLSALTIERRRAMERDQLGLFPALTNAEPGDARVTIATALRTNLAAGHAVAVSASRYFALSSPVARRIYRLLEFQRPAHEDGLWRVPLELLAEQLPLVQRFPSHLQRVLQPAHEMLLTAGLLQTASITRDERAWFVEYTLSRPVA
ncbi:MAG: replication initiator protein A [Gemmatimonadaceae bacterium]|nr:replication initiator protein A [Gemmatimonadaceae bacterium]